MSNNKYVDIGANLLDERFTEGSYRVKQRHEPDFDIVVQRAYDVGVRRIIMTAGTLEESRYAIKKVREIRQKSKTGDHNDFMKFWCTVGVHPTRCMEFEDAPDAEEHFQSLLELAKLGKQEGIVAAVGEMGLDYDRLEFCPKDIQHKYILKQLALAEATGLPMFLHNRNNDDDLYEVLSSNEDKWASGGGVVHSFDDSADLAAKFIDLGLFIGLNGCSLRTEENLEVVKTLPLDKILLETDCPYCDVKRTHAGYEHVKTQFESKHEKKYEKGKCVKGRNEPCQIVQVAEVIAGVRGIAVDELADACYANSMKLYGWLKEDSNTD